MLAFRKFWRATHHHRQEILSKRYPIAIRACLKAWGDQCYVLSRSFQNLCHVSCIQFQGLRFYTELEIYIRFNCTKFISQFHLLTIFQAWFITNNSKICLVFVLLHENLVDFLQIKYISNLLCITTTYSENPEGGS